MSLSAIPLCEEASEEEEARPAAMIACQGVCCLLDWRVGLRLGVEGNGRVESYARRRRRVVCVVS